MNPRDPRMLLYTSLLLIACSSYPEEAFAPQDTGAVPRPAAATVTALSPSRDGHITSTHPDRNSGHKDSMDVARPLRTLLAFDQAAIVAAVGAGPLQRATLRLSIGRTAENWGPNGRPIDMHRMLVPWTEMGATWNCAIDAVPKNSATDCSGSTAWDMTTPAPHLWASSRTDRVHVTNNMTGVIEFDVTADVAAFLAGAPNEGWVIKKGNEEQQGRIVFLTRESSSAPQLSIEVAVQDQWPLLTTTFPLLDSTKTVELSPGEGYYRSEAILRFVDGTSDDAKRLLFGDFQIQVLGVTRSGNFFVRFPDPGPTLADYRRFTDSVRADPRVAAVAPIDYGPESTESHARYPDDGAGLSRGDWLAASSSTWALQAIRAPLAWGCETGAYGSEVPRVGVLELGHVRDHPEYVAQVARLWSPPDSIVATLKAAVPLTPARELEQTDHGTAVVGTLSATGDNQMGVSGATWRTHLFLYQGLTSAKRLSPLGSTFYLYADEVAQDEVNILTISSGPKLRRGATLAEREGAIASLRGDLAELLDRRPMLLVIAAAGNGGNRGSLQQQIASVDTIGILRVALVKLKEQPQYSDRIVIVTGTQHGASLWAGSDYYPSGGTDIAAPAQGVTVLARWSGGTSVALKTQDGTSLAAPLVAGIAAQLYTMDPTLTPAEVKSLILRGAQVPRIDPVTGAMIDSLQLRIPVPGTSDHIYQADAYGALQLLSRERPGTPICGLRVWSDGAQVHIERNTPEMMPGPGEVSSVAQGGRLISAWNTVYRLAPGGFTEVGSDPNSQAIYFTERDTVYVRNESSQSGNGFRSDLIVRIGSGDSARTRPETNVTAGFPGGSWSAHFQEHPGLRFSPTSDWVFVRWDWSNSEYECTPGANVPFGGGTYLLPLRPGLTPHTFSTYLGNVCDGSPQVGSGIPVDRVGWRNTGNEFIGASLPDWQSPNTTLRRYTVGATVQATGPAMTGSQNTVGPITWLPESGRVELWEYHEGSCQEVVRSAASLLVLTTNSCAGWRPVTPLLRSPQTALRQPQPNVRGHVRPQLDPHGASRVRAVNQVPTRYN